MVGLLYLAAKEDFKQTLAQCVLESLNEGRPILLSQLQQRFKNKLHPFLTLLSRST